MANFDGPADGIAYIKALEQKVADIAAVVSALGAHLAGNSVLYGVVSASGSILGGTGFTVTKNGTGDYTITPDVAFSGHTSGAGSAISGAGRVVNTHASSPADGSAHRFAIFTATTGAAVDVDFCFTVGGPV